MYRSPHETVASLLHQRPSWFDLIQCPRELQARFFPSVSALPKGALSPLALFAHAWRSAAEAALALPPERTLMVEYEELVLCSDSVLERVLRHCGQAQSRGTIQRMVAARFTYSKDPAGTAAFDPKGTHRRPALSAPERAEVDSVTHDLWTRLEARRNCARVEPCDPMRGTPA